MLTQLPGGGNEQIVHMTAPADSCVLGDQGEQAEFYIGCIVSDSPHDTITIGTGLTVKIRATFAGWLPTEADRSLTEGTWKLKPHASSGGSGGGGGEITVSDATEDVSMRTDGRTLGIFGKVRRKTELTFKVSVPASQALGFYDLVWTDAAGIEHSPLPEQARIVHPMVVMLCMDGVNGELFQEALLDNRVAGTGLDLIFGTASNPGGSSSSPGNAMPNKQWFSPSPTATALNSLPSITWCNWGTIFTGKEPGQHGVLGNSFFRRDVDHSRPVFSANAESAYDAESDHRNAAVFGVSPLTYPGTDTLYQDFTGVEHDRSAVSVHTWYPNQKTSDTDFSGLDQTDYGKAITQESNLHCLRYLAQGNIIVSLR